MTERHRIVGLSPAILNLRQLIARVARTEATVLIVGERGTGKELVATAIHHQSRRAERQLLSLNCAALGTELLTSELFGHERGAFTGAVQRRTGLLASADGGTLFLDEVGDLPPAAQSVFLRFLELREVRPVGANATFPVNVRILAATNKDLTQAIARGEFRADLHDRLSEFVIETPPLRCRGGDVLVLADYFTRFHVRRHRVRVRGIAPGARLALQTYSWPGNVRELKKTMSRAVVLAAGRWIETKDLQLPPVRETCPTLAVPATGASVEIPLVRDLAWRLAVRQGCVRRRDLVEGFGISEAAAARELAALVRAGVLRRSGRRGGVRYAAAHG